MHQPVMHPKPAENYPQEVEYNPATQRLVYIHLTAEDPDPTSIHIEDWDALGLWAVVVPKNVSRVANVALDAFNSVVPIKWLDSVRWTVWDVSSGLRLKRDESIEWYTQQHLADSVHFIAHLG